MTRRSTILRMPVFVALIGGALVLTACDQRDTRVERAQDIAGAALEQVRSPGEDAPGRRDLTELAPIERAVGGGLVSPEATQAATTRRSRFAIGSVISKPRDLPQLPSPQEALRMQSGTLDGGLPEMAPLPEAITEPGDATGDEERSGSSPADRKKAGSGPDAAPLERLKVPEGLSERLPRDLGLKDRKLARRAMITERAVVRQGEARTAMIDALASHGLAGDIEVTRTGQILCKIEKPVAPEAEFRVERDAPRQRPLMKRRGPPAEPAPEFALEAGIACPDNPTPELLNQSPMLATECFLESLRESGQFEYVEKDFIFDHQFARRPDEPPVTVVSTPDDPLWDMQWNFFSNGNGEGESRGGAGFVDFWADRKTRGSRDVVVAVVDTGLQMDHPDLRDSMNVVDGWDMVSDPAMGNDGDGRDPDPNDPGDLCDPTVPFAEDSYHGTHVAGTIGATASNNATGVAGGAWDVTVVPVRALGKCGGRLSDINDGIRWAGGLVPAFDRDGNEVWNENPADIINLSIGLFQYCPASLQDAINEVTERGVAVVSAAGNEQVSTDFYSPGGCENVISVAASDARGQMAPYSNHGDAVDLLAPGGDLSRDDNGDGRPDGILSAKLSSDCTDPVTGEQVGDCYYAFEQGTSMAAPHVSAALALLKAYEPDLVGAALVDRLRSALVPREQSQCSGDCNLYFGTDPIPGTDNLCYRPCGGGLLDLGRVSGPDPSEAP